MKQLIAIIFSLVMYTGSRANDEVSRINATELNAFFDGVWQSQKISNDLMGAVITVVNKDGVVFSKGYGYANYETLEKVSPDTTLFRIASISKPFTWVAVMQLVEEGKLDLHADVNQYLTAFQIPDTFPEPITMAHLMSHNAGFEDIVLDLGRASADELMPLGQYLADHLPRRVRPPGEHSSYSNHSTALAAHIVENIAGMSWSDYIEQRILAPLQMHHTVARHPMPDHLQPLLSKSYDRSGGLWHEQDFLYWFIYPAGMMSSTGADMARFIRMQLNDGSLDGRQILKPETLKQFHSPIYKPFEGANAWLHGQYEMSRNNTRIFGHGGDLNGFHSAMLIFPDHELGLFVSFNTESGSAARSATVNSFVNEFFPADEISHIAPPENTDGYGDYAGVYSSLRRTFSDFARLSLLINYSKVSVTDDGYLSIATNGRVTRFVELGTDHFKSIDSATELRFLRDENKDVTHIEFKSFPHGTMDKLGFFDSPVTHQMVFGLIGLIMLSYSIYWPVRMVRRQIYKVTTPGLAAWAYCTAWLIAISILVSLLSLTQSLGNPSDFLFGIPGQIELLILMIWIVSFLTIVPLVYCLSIWRNKTGTRSERINYTLFTTGAVINVVLAWYWNLIG